MNLHTIKSLGRYRAGDKFRFVVSMAGDGCKHVTCDVSGAELRSYASFQVALLERFGWFFRDDYFETPRLGARYWADGIQELMSNITDASGVEVSTR